MSINMSMSMNLNTSTNMSIDMSVNLHTNTCNITQFIMSIARKMKFNMNINKMSSE